MKARAALIISFSVFLGLLAAGISLILPNQYTAKGLLVVNRKADSPSAGFFTYEGYYAQQNAGSYTGTFVSVLQSPANLKSSGINLDPKQLSRLIKVKREGSQAIIFSVKGNTPRETQTMWEKISDAAIRAHEQLKLTADPLITVSKTPNSPVVLKTYPDWITVFGTAVLFSAVSLSALILIIRYIKEDHDY